MAQHENIRTPAVAGQFYPNNPGQLKSALAEYIQKGGQIETGTIRGIIAPHAGYSFSGTTAGKAYAPLKGRRDIECVIVLAPSHRVPFDGVSVGDFGFYRTPLGDVEVDTECCYRLINSSGCFVKKPDAQAFEHALEVQIPFLQSVLNDFKLVPLVCGQMSKNTINEAASILAEHGWQENTLWVISSDFTHYGSAFGYVPFSENIATRIEELDKGAIEHIKNLDTEGFHTYLQKTGATICGADPIALFMQVLQHTETKITCDLVDYTNTGKLTGDYSHTVSYASLMFTEETENSDYYLDGEEKQQLLKLARDTLESQVYNREMPTPDEESLTKTLSEEGACFVTLRHNGNLRGCIGTIIPRQPLYKDVRQNAINAGFRDPRFAPLSKDELPNVTVEISVLTPTRRIDSPEDFQPGKHGIILERGQASSVFLPQVAGEQGWDRETTLDNLAMKAGLKANDWRKDATFYIFEAIVFSEE